MISEKKFDKEVDLIIVNAIREDIGDGDHSSLASIPYDATGKAKLLVNLLVNVKKCKLHWCKIEVVKNKAFVGWIKKTSIWGVEKK